MDEEYNSVADRQKASQARVHTDLTQPARERIAQITANPLRVNLSNPYGRNGIPDKIINKSINWTYEDVGYGPIRKFVQNAKTHQHQAKETAATFPTEINRENIDTDSNLTVHRRIIQNAERDAVLAYLENLLEICYRSHPLKWGDIVANPTKIDKSEKVKSTTDKVNVVLETEGILWELNFGEGHLNFRPIGSEMMAEADEAFSAVASGKKWVRVASPYNDAYDQYKDRKFDRAIPEKLYNSIEELARVICVDRQDWLENRELNLSEYLHEMNERGLFEPNPIMRAEIQDLTNSMEKAFQKAGKERHNDHHEIDREYCTLMLHQVSAYLTYIIRQYEEQYE